MDRNMITHSIEEEVAKEVASYMGTRRIQVFKVFGTEIVCRGDFSRHDNAPKGQISAASFSYHFDVGHRAIVQHKPLVLTSRRAIESYVRLVDAEENIFSGTTVCFLHDGNALEAYMDDYLPLLRDRRVHLSWYFHLDDDVEAKKATIQANRDLLIDAIWDLVAQ